MEINFADKRLSKITESGNVYISSDHHFCHYNIIKYTGRPYRNIVEMKEGIIRNHNNVVPENNSVWFCIGDFMMGRQYESVTKFDELRDLVSSMNGKFKILIQGNHDKFDPVTYFKAGFNVVFRRNFKLPMILEDGRCVMLTHKPYDDINCCDYNQLYRKVSNPLHIHDSRPNYLLLDDNNPNKYKIRSDDDFLSISGNVICGHVHQLFKKYAKGNIVNVSLDVWNMSPVKLDKVLDLLD